MLIHTRFSGVSNLNYHILQVLSFHVLSYLVPCVNKTMKTRETGTIFVICSWISAVFHLLFVSFIPKWDIYDLKRDIFRTLTKRLLAWRLNSIFNITSNSVIFGLEHIINSLTGCKCVLFLSSFVAFYFCNIKYQSVSGNIFPECIFCILNDINEAGSIHIDMSVEITLSRVIYTKTIFRYHTQYAVD